MALFLVLLVPIVVVFIMLRVYYIKTARELKRIEGVGKSPLHFYKKQLYSLLRDKLCVTAHQLN